MSIQNNLPVYPCGAKTQVADSQPSKGTTEVPKHDVAVMLILAKVESNNLDLDKKDELSQEERNELIAEQVISDAVAKMETLEQAQAFLDRLQGLVPKDALKLTQFIQNKQGVLKAYANDSQIKDLNSQLNGVNKEIDEANLGNAWWFATHPKTWYGRIREDFNSKYFEGKANDLTNGINTIKGNYLAEMQVNTCSAQKDMLQANANDKVLQSAEDSIKGFSEAEDIMLSK